MSDAANLEGGSEMTDLEKMMQVVISGARSLFEEHGGIATHWLLETADGGLALLNINFRNEEEQGLSELAVRKFIEQHGCVRAVFFSEAWIVEADENADLRTITRPENNPDRFEAITFQAEEKDGETISGHIKITRNDGKATLGQTEIYHTVSSGRFSNIFNQRKH
jgi:hypothetical protein